MVGQWLSVENAPLNVTVIIASKCGKVGQGFLYKVTQAGETCVDKVGDIKAMMDISDSYGERRVTPIRYQELPTHPYK